MPEKQIVTTSEIIQDIINSIKHPAEKTSKTDPKKSTVLCILIAIAFCIIEILYPKFVVFVMLSIIPLLFAILIIMPLKVKHQIKNVRIEDYEITTDILSHKEHDSYVIRYKYQSRIVNLYMLTFESKKMWNVPPENYHWSERNFMSYAKIHENSHRGDTFITVIHKKTGKIVMAYNTKVFEYKT